LHVKQHGALASGVGAHRLRLRRLKLRAKHRLAGEVSARVRC
jgi:hypothetical protein